MAQPAAPNTYTVTLPHSAYRWNLLDSATHTEDHISAVYEHQSADAWCAIQPESSTGTTTVRLFTTEKLPEYVETDAECLISLLTNTINTQTVFMFTGTQRGKVAEAYSFINSSP